MAYNEKLDAMNSNMAANAAENNSRAMSNFMNLGINTLSNISDIVSKLDEDKANDLIDDANNKMTAYINTSQNEYMYDSDGNIIDDTDAIMSGLYNKADEIANGYSARYRKRISSSLKSSVNSRANSIYSSYADMILNERKTSINSLVQSELAAFDSGSYGEVAVGKYNELVEYVKTHPEDDEMKVYMDSINSKLSGGEDFIDIYADISYGLFLKKCNLNGMSKSERERIYGDNVVKSIYQESLLTGLIYSDNLGYKKQVIDGDMTDEEWIANAIEHDRKFGYTINGEKYNYTFEELENRRTKYQKITNDMKVKAYASYDRVLQAKDSELSSMTEPEIRNFIVEKGSPEAFLDWLTEPYDIDGNPVSINRNYAMASIVKSKYYHYFVDAKVTNELYSYVERLKSVYSSKDSSESILSIMYDLSNETPEVRAFFEGIFGKINNYKDDIVDINSITKTSLFTLYNKKAINSNVLLGDPISTSMSEISSKKIMDAKVYSWDIKSYDEALDLARNATSEEEQTIYLNRAAILRDSENSKSEQLNYSNAMLDVTEIYFKNGKSYDTLFDNDKALFNEIASKNGLTEYQKDTLYNMLKTKQTEIDYNNASSDSLFNLVGWYYNTGIANNYQYSVEEVEDKAKEFGVDTNSSAYIQFVDGVMKVNAEKSSLLAQQSVSNKTKRYYNEKGSYVELLKDDKAMSDITSGMDETAAKSFRKTIEAMAEEESTGKKLIDGITKFNKWYYLTEDGTGKTYEDAVKKVKEFGLDPYDSEVRAILDSIMKSQSSQMKSERYTIAYSKVKNKITDYYEKNGSYEGLTEDVLKGFEGASDLTDAQIASIYSEIYEKASNERIKKLDEAKTQEEKDLLQKEIDSINNAKVEIEKKIIDNDITSYEDAVNILVEAGATQTEAESYVLANFASLYKQEKMDSYIQGVEYVVDYVNSSKDYDENEIDAWLVENGYNATARERILYFASMVKDGYNNTYTPSEIAGGLLGENESVTYIQNQKIYTDSIQGVLIGNCLENTKKGTEEYLYTINEIQYQCKKELYDILENEGDDVYKIAFEYIRDNYYPSADQNDFFEGMDVGYIAEKYMISTKAEAYLSEYRVFMDNYENMKYDEKRSFKDVFTVDSQRYTDDLSEKIHRQKVSIGAESITPEDYEYTLYSKGGICYNEILSKIMSASSLEDARNILRSESKYLPEAESKELFDALENMNINSLLSANGIDTTYENLFSGILGAKTDYFDDFSSYIASHPDEYNNIVNAISSYKTSAGENRISEAHDKLQSSFTEMYNRFASSIMKTSQPEGILGLKSEGYLVGDILSGQLDSEKYKSTQKDGKYNEKFGEKRISAFADAIPSISNGNLGWNASIRADNIKEGNLGSLTNDAQKSISILKGLIYDTNQNYKDNEIETYSLAISILASGYNLSIDSGRLSTDKEYLNELKNNVCLALEDINRNSSSGYYGDFTTIINTAAILTKDEIISRQYKTLSTNYSEGMKFEGYDADGNIITRNGSTVKAVYDYGGDLSSLTVTYKDKNGETNTVEDISIHDAKSTSKKLEYIGISKTTKYGADSSLTFPKEDIEKVNVYNKDEFALKGENSYFIIPYYDNSMFTGYMVRYKQISYSEAKNLVENGYTGEMFGNSIEGIF